MEIINEASKSLLDNMFEDMAMDITSDIHVMTTMMAQDGLTAQAPSDLTRDRDITGVSDDVNLTFGTSATMAAAQTLSSAQAAAAAPQAQAAEDKQILKF